MNQDLEIVKLDQILNELDNKINELNIQLLDVISNIKYGISLSEEKKKMGIEIASLSANAMVELQGMKISGQVNTKIAGYMQVGAAIAGLGALLFTGITHLIEKAKILDFLKQVKELDGKQAALIKINYEKMELLVNELQDSIQNKIIRIIDYLSKFTLTDERAINVLQKLHSFIVRYIDFNQKYHVFNAYKEHYALYLDKEVFSLDISMQKAIDAKNKFFEDIVILIDRLNKGYDTIGAQYLLLNYKVLKSNKLLRDKIETIKDNIRKKIISLKKIEKIIPDIREKPLHILIDKKAQEIEAVGSEQSATKEKLAKAIEHIKLSERENRKNNKNQTEKLLLEYIDKVIYKDNEINKENIKEFDMRLLSEIVNWYEGSRIRIGNSLAIFVSIIYAAIVFFIEKWLLIFTPLLYWLIKKLTSNSIVSTYTSEDKKRLEKQFGEGTIYQFWILDRLNRHDFATKLVKLFKRKS